MRNFLRRHEFPLGRKRCVRGGPRLKEKHMATTIRFLVAAGLIGVGGRAFSGVPMNNMSASVAIDHEKGSFEGALGISLKGTFNKANLRWNGSVKNTSPHRIFGAAFCMKAFDTDDNLIQVQETGETCLLRFSGTEWGASVPLSFKGKRNIRIAPGNKEVVQVSRYEISATEVFDDAPNVRHIVAPCPVVWRSAIREFADSSFHPKVIQQDSYVGNFEYEGGLTAGRTDTRSMLKRYTNARLGFTGPTWTGFRIDNASLYLRDEEPGVCTAEISMSFSGWADNWYEVGSNYTFERLMLDKIEQQSKLADERELDRAISRLPTSALEAEPAEKAVLTITSEPLGAEIEINGEWIGNTPTTLKVDAGKLTLKVMFEEHQDWQRTFSVGPGDERTINVRRRPAAPAPVASGPAVEATSKKPDQP